MCFERRRVGRCENKINEVEINLIPLADFIHVSILKVLDDLKGKKKGKTIQFIKN